MHMKSSASTAFLKILIVLTIIITIFWISLASASPLGKTIRVCVTCAETTDPVAEGLGITLWTSAGDKLATLYTGPKGCVEFGSGLPDGDYVITFYWNAAFRYEISIDCSQIVWQFDYRVPNPVIIKHFEYGDLGIPIEGLVVYLDEDGTDLVKLETDATGTVRFGGEWVDVCKVYHLEYMWGGVAYAEGPIHFEYDANGELQVCLWEKTNYLEPKSGGGLEHAYAQGAHARTCHRLLESVSLRQSF